MADLIGRPIESFFFFFYLRRHVHEEHGGDGSLSLTVALLGTVQRVRLQHAEQVLLPACVEKRMDGIVQ